MNSAYIVTFDCELRTRNTFTAILDINRKCIFPGVFPLAFLMAGRYLMSRGDTFVCVFMNTFTFFSEPLLGIMYNLDLQFNMTFLQKKWHLEKKNDARRTARKKKDSRIL